ncbi:hypothetical protein KIL84_008326 [Mauremys mutica]|uniref:Uncharacterized protein n=1 Tax=Mauremys mutica TaxID=74926 RepID=A0A9D4ATB2_9SAUR|nr:hypothetical protein KIL84_008326 [Mauremys mutica]
MGHQERQNILSSIAFLSPGSPQVLLVREILDMQSKMCLISKAATPSRLQNADCNLKIPTAAIFHFFSPPTPYSYSPQNLCVAEAKAEGVYSQLLPSVCFAVTGAVREEINPTTACL